MRMATALLFALYAYLFSALALPAAGLCLICAVGDRTQEAGSPPPPGRRCFRVWMVALLFLPLARNAWLVNGSEGPPASPSPILGSTLYRLLSRTSACGGRAGPPGRDAGVLCIGASCRSLASFCPARTTRARIAPGSCPLARNAVAGRQPAAGHNRYCFRRGPLFSLCWRPFACGRWRAA